MRFVQFLPFLFVLSLNGCKKAGAQSSAANSQALEPALLIDTAQFNALVFDYTALLAGSAAQPEFRSDKPVIVDYYAQWCQPCKLSAPMFDRLAADYGDRVNFYRIDVDKDSEPFAILGADSIPFFLFVWPDGKMDAQAGYSEGTEAAFRKIIEERML